MFNKTIAKRYVKTNWILFASITAILSLFMFLIIYVFGNVQSMGGGMGGAIPLDFTSFVGNGFFKGLGLLLPMIFVIVTCNKIIASSVNKGSMAGTLSAGVKRNQVSVTNLICFIISLILMFLIIMGIGFLASSIFQAGKLDNLAFLRLILGNFIFQLAISGICFFASCLFNTSGKSLALGAGLVVGFYVINVIKELDDSLSFMKYLTINTLLDNSALISGSGFIIQLISLALIGAVGFIAGIIVFKNKDLPL